MKLKYPEKFKTLLDDLELSFSPYEEMNDDQEIELIEAVENYFSIHGVNETGDGENETGALCADFLTWIAGEDVSD